MGVRGGENKFSTYLILESYLTKWVSEKNSFIENMYYRVFIENDFLFNRYACWKYLKNQRFISLYQHLKNEYNAFFRQT